MLRVKDQALRGHLELRPDHAETMLYLGRALCRLNKFFEGESFLKPAKDGDRSDDILIHMMKALGDGIFIEKDGLIPRRQLKATDLVPGTLAQVNRLTTPHGKRLNGKYGVVRSKTKAGGVSPSRSLRKTRAK